MSTIRKHPYTEALIAKLTNEQVNSLLGLLNGTGSINEIQLIDRTSIGNLGTCSYVRLEYLPGRKSTGFLIKVPDSTDLVLLSYQGSGPNFGITRFDINNVLYNIDEPLSTEELRRIIDDTHEASGDAWVEKMKEVLDYDEESQTIQNGTNVYVDGTLEVDDEASFNDHFSVFADDSSRMIDANTANKTTSLYGAVKIGSAETRTPITVNGNSLFYGKLQNVESGVPHDNWFIETNELKVNNITFQDTPEGVRNAVNIVGADINVGTDHLIKIGNTTLSEAQLQSLLALLENNG